MAATCAACLQPIRSGTPFLLAGTEVFHRNSSCAARIRESVGWKQRMEIDRLRIEANNANDQLADAERSLERARDDRDQAREAQRQAERALRSQEQRRFTAENERDQAVDAARRLAGELDLARQLARSVPVSAGSATTPESTAAKDDRDASEVRFSLLELDEK